MKIKLLEPIGFEDRKEIVGLKKQFSNLNLQFEEFDTRGMEEESLINVLKGADAIILTSRPLSEMVISSCPTLKFISVAFTGIEHISQEACKNQGIEIKNAAGYATHAVAELALCLTLNLLRKVLPAAESITTLKVEDHAFLGNELNGKEVGIIGGGAIGLETGRLFAAFNCNVSIYNRHPLKETPTFAIQKDLESVLKNSDILSLHVPLTDETYHLINRERLSLCKPNLMLINTARGKVVDQEALMEALIQKRIAGAALDVFDQEPPLEKNHPLLKIPNLILTPHLGFYTKEALARRSKIAFDNLKNWISKSNA